ncbi:MAG: hypothetical protein IJ387_02185, partial [Thermoguttaceae bacterium]|nr:hypothetical protein [Thermoguttaceae bacterium]
RKQNERSNESAGYRFLSGADARRDEAVRGAKRRRFAGGIRRVSARFEGGLFTGEYALVGRRTATASTRSTSFTP